MIYMINCFEFQNTKDKLQTWKWKIGEKNTADSNCLRQVKPVVPVCMDITYHFIYRPQGKVKSVYYPSTQI